MADVITSKTGEQVPVTVFGLTDDQTRVELTGITVVVQSGDATFTPPDGVTFVAKAGAAGSTVYAVTGSQAHGPDVTDTLTYTVTAVVVEGPVATTLGFDAGAAEPQLEATTLPAAKKAK